MDLRMPDGDGVDAIGRLRADGGEARIIVLTTYDTDADILRAVEAGAAGYLLKDTPRADLAAAIRAAARGETVLAPVVAGRLVTRVRGARRRAEALSAREIEVLALVARGLTNADRAGAVRQRGDRQDAPDPRLRQAGRHRPHRRRHQGDGARRPAPARPSRAAGLACRLRVACAWPSVPGRRPVWRFWLGRDQAGGWRPPDEEVGCCIVREGCRVPVGRFVRPGRVLAMIVECCRASGGAVSGAGGLSSVSPVTSLLDPETLLRERGKPPRAQSHSPMLRSCDMGVALVE